MTARDINDNRNDTNDETRENKRTRNTSPVSRPPLLRDLILRATSGLPQIFRLHRGRDHVQHFHEIHVPRLRSCHGNWVEKHSLRHRARLRKNSLGNLMGFERTHWAIWYRSATRVGPSVILRFLRSLSCFWRIYEFELVQLSSVFGARKVRLSSFGSLLSTKLRLSC